MSNPYQGKFYLALGAFVFTLLTLGLRLLGLKLKEGNKSISTGSSDTWLGPEDLEIIDIFEETADIKTFRLKRKGGKRMPMFKPGQFLSFKISDHKKVYRSYSISGSCENQSLIQVSIKILPDGIGSNWFHTLKVGETVLAHPPGGLFTDDDLEGESRVFIAGGIGITPFLSMLLTAVDRGENNKTTLFYGARSTADLAFHEILLTLAKRNPNFNYYPILSEDSDGNWDGLTGFITYDLILSKITDPKFEKFFFCGPPIMTDGITDSLIENGVDKKSIHSEKFVSPTSISEEDLDISGQTIFLDGQAYEYAGKNNLLEFFEDQNVELPFSCRSGVCGACKVKCVGGSATSLTDSGLTEDEKGDHILACVSYPEKGLKIEQV